MNRNYGTTPVLLGNAAKGWFALYKKALQDHEPAEEIAGIYCLFFALELHLKAYLSLKNKTFAKEEKLTKLSHNLNSIYGEVSKVAPPDFIQKLKRLLKKYNLFVEDFTDLRYPVAGRHTTFHPDLFDDARHGFDEMFDFINKEIRGWNFEKWSAIPV